MHQTLMFLYKSWVANFVAFLLSNAMHVYSHVLLFKKSILAPTSSVLTCMSMSELFTNHPSSVMCK